ncbi:hypothetical protein ACQ1ZI_17535, partial [Enterococcus faecalis]|uniref:hypothetical protein n=1 Tax=Enterococcus faecalis TaxID=1351 RepID=UPI003D6C293A
VGRRFKSEETYVYLWLTQVDVWQKLAQYCKIIFLQLKIYFFKVMHVNEIKSTEQGSYSGREAFRNRWRIRKSSKRNNTRVLGVRTSLVVLWL